MNIWIWGGISLLKILYIRSVSSIPYELSFNLKNLKSFIDEYEFDVEEEFQKIKSYFQRYKEFKISSNKDNKVLNIDRIHNFGGFPDILCVLNKTEILYAISCQLTTLTKSFSQFKNLKYLYLSKNNFDNIPNIIFKVNSLSLLDLSHNFISKIPDNILDLEKLKTLNLQYNRLTKVSTKFKRLKLTHLFLDFNHSNNEIASDGIYKINNNIFKTLPLSVEMFSFKGSNLTEIPEELELPNITILILSKNNLTRLPQSFKNLGNLISLFLDENRFSFLSKEILYLRQLFYLSLSKNYITNVILKENELSYLKVLMLKSNNILNFIITNRALNALTNLDLSYNNIVSMSKSNIYEKLELNKISLLPNLNQLKISFNSFHSMKDVYRYKKLASLSVDFKRNVRLQSEFINKCFYKLSNFKNIRYLKITSIFISEFPKSLTNIKALVELDLSNNKITNIDKEISGLNISILNLHNNLIIYIFKELFDNIDVNTINLSNNKIKYIPPCKSNPKATKKIILSQNPLEIFGKEGQWGIFDIPPTLIETIELDSNVDYNFQIPIEDLMINSKEDEYKWNLKIIQQVKSKRVENHKLNYNELKIIIMDIIVDLQSNDLKNDILTYFRIIYQREQSNAIVNNMGDSFRNTIKDYFETIILKIAQLTKKNKKLANEKLHWLSYCFNLCYDGQLEHYISMLKDLEGTDYGEINLIINNFISKIKHQTLSYITTSNQCPENVHIMSYWRNQLSDILGLENVDYLYDFLIPFNLLKSKDYVLFHFFKIFSIKNVLNELYNFINSNCDNITKLAKILYERKDICEEKYIKYFYYEGSVEDIRIIGIKRNGIIEFLKIYKYIEICI